MADSKEWKQERPSWCPHQDCVFSRRAMDAICGGRLPNPEPHDGDFNTHRICVNGAMPDGVVFDLQVNKSDLWWFEWIFSSLHDTKDADAPELSHLEIAALRRALEGVKAIVVGEKHPNWTDDRSIYDSRGRIADICDVALGNNR